MVWRQPFPGPGLAIRIIGEVTAERVATLRRRLHRMQEVEAAGLYDDLWQSFAVLTDTRTVGVQGDCRTYGIRSSPRRHRQRRHDGGLGPPALRV